MNGSVARTGVCGSFSHRNMQKGLSRSQPSFSHEIASRTTLRLTTRLLVKVADGLEEVLGTVVNMSAAGLLLETDADLEPGQHVILSIDIDRQDEPVSAKAEVVRKADPNRDGVEGIGVRFLSFAGDSRERLEAILGEAFHIPNDEVRTTT